MKHAPDFKTHEEHDKWVLENAEYFSIIGHRHRLRLRIETPTLQLAQEVAKALHKDGYPSSVLIYAVCGVYSAYIEVIWP